MIGWTYHTHTPWHKHALSTWWSSPVPSSRHFKGPTTNLLSYPAIRPVIMTNDLPENDQCPTITSVSKCDRKHCRIFIKSLSYVLSLQFDMTGGEIIKFRMQCSSQRSPLLKLGGSEVELGSSYGRTPWPLQVDQRQEQKCLK